MIFCRVNQSAWCSPALTGLQVLRDQTQFSFSLRHLERRPPVSGRACSPACHPERSEGALRPGNEILRCAQDDRPSLHMSASPSASLTYDVSQEEWMRIPVPPIFDAIAEQLQENRQRARITKRGANM